MMKRKRNARWEDMNKNNIEFGQLIQHFEAFNYSEGKSPRTVEWYNQVLSLFLHWLEAEGKATKLGAIGEPEVRDFILHLRGKNRNGKPTSTHTVANRIRAMRAFFSWLAKQEYTDVHILAGLKQPRTTEILIEILTPEEISSLFSNINQNTALGARNAAIIALFLDTGPRLSEVAGLNVTDVHLDQRYVKVMGKGSKERMLIMGTTCQKSLLHYYHHFRFEPAHTGVDSFFLTLDGYPMTKDAICSMMDRLAKTSGVKRLHPHLLRHTYATRFLLNGGDVFLLKQNLGHSTLAMVERYRHIASRQAALLSEPFSPLDRMNLRQLRYQRRSNIAGASGTIYPNAAHRSNDHIHNRYHAKVKI